MGFLRRTAGMIAVIDFMASPVIEETQGAGALFIMVFESERSHAARDAGVIVYVRITGFARIEALNCVMFTSPHSFQESLKSYPSLV